MTKKPKKSSSPKNPWKGKKNLRVDFGAGSKRYENYLALDIRPDADIVCDLREGIPLDKNSVDVGRCEHILEHFSPGEELIGIWNELWRVMHPEGQLRVEVPSAENLTAFQDPTHKTFYVPATFEYFNVDAFLYKEVGRYYGIKPWKLLPDQSVPGDECNPQFIRRFMQPVK